MANSKRGFAAMDPKRRSEIAAMGGRASRRGRKKTSSDNQ
ncbi:MAG TPA: KGG domain-containing protein [Candidatus Saccharimonadales bacterium]|nr:KGG domain-containing protein [Candidatus Saccharimonadales bacterium]